MSSAIGMMIPKMKNTIRTAVMSGLCLPRRSGVERPPFAADGGVGLARTDELLVDKDRNRRDADHDERHGKRGLGVLGLAVHVQLAGQGNEVYLGA